MPFAMNKRGWQSGQMRKVEGLVPQWVREFKPRPSHSRLLKNKMRISKTSNSALKGFIQELQKKANEHNAKIWKRIAQDLAKPTRKRRIVNLYKINKYTKENEIVVIPGKVLAVGDLDHSVTVAAFTFSETAQEKINKIGKVISLQDLIKEDPKGKRIRILG